MLNRSATMEKEQMSEVILHVPVPKAGTTWPLPYDSLKELAAKHNDIFLEIITQGLKAILNRGQGEKTGIVSVKGMEKDSDAAVAMREKILAAVQGQWELALEGKTRITGGKTKVKKGAENVKAMQIARAIVKDALKRAGHKVSTYPAKEITKLAETLLDGEEGEEIRADARAELEKIQSKSEKAGKSIDLSSAKPDPKLVAAAKKKGKKGKAEDVDPALLRGAVQATRRGPQATAH